MSIRLFDTIHSSDADSLMAFLNKVTRSRIVIIQTTGAVFDGLGDKRKHLAYLLKSDRIMLAEIGDTWSYVGILGIRTLCERLSTDTALNCSVRLKTDLENQCRNHDLNRRSFCQRYEGYEECSCRERSSHKPSPSVSNAHLVSVPILVIASSRPYYLHRCLRKLMSIPGIITKNILISIDGNNLETKDFVELLYGLTVMQQAINATGTAKVSQHYKISIARAFEIFDTANYLIIVEEDLEVSYDFLHYFNHFLPVYEMDASVYCISAWNDLGYNHTSADLRQFYRVEGMPGLGWILSKSIFRNELQTQWPTAQKQWDWDMWMRSPQIRKGRECIIPDVSRTFHFGQHGLHTQPEFYERYFLNHAFHQALNLPKFQPADAMVQENYETNLKDSISSGYISAMNSPQSTSRNLTLACDLIGQSLHPNVTNILVILVVEPASCWLMLAKCLGIWDLDTRGKHKTTWRLHWNSAPLIVVGCPQSVYCELLNTRYVPLHC